MGRSQRHLIEQRGYASNNENVSEGAIGLGVVRPALTSIAPTTEAHGNPSFLLTATGTDFVPASTIMFNGIVQATTYVSPTTVSATIDGSAAVAGTVQVKVNTGSLLSAPQNFVFT